MLVKNVSARGWWLGGKLIAPLDTVEFADSFKADIAGIDDLVIVEAKKLSKKEQAEADKLDEQSAPLDTVETDNE